MQSVVIFRYPLEPSPTDATGQRGDVSGVTRGGHDWLECGVLWAWSIGLERLNRSSVRKIRIRHKIE